MRKLLIFVVVLLLLAVGADRLAVRVAESALATGIQRSQNLASKPRVSIEGFPFLTQVISGRFAGITFSASDIGGTNGQQSVRLATLTAEATNIHTSPTFSTVSAGSLSGHASIRYSDLSSALSASGAAVSYAGRAADGRGRIAITGSVTVLGQKLTGTISAEIKVVGVNQLGFDSVQVEQLKIPQALIKTFTAAFTKQLTVTQLPAGLVLRTITASPNGITAVLSGTDVVLKN